MQPCSGVTTNVPNATDQPAETADEVDNSWSLGYDGAAHLNGIASCLSHWMVPNVLHLHLCPHFRVHIVRP